jgi:ATP-dependent Clp endopeptidase proteolytic subunit ClpP
MLTFQQLETEKYVTALKKAQATKAELELQEFSAAVRSAQASNFRHRTYDFVSEVTESTVETALDTITRWAREEHDRGITVRFTSGGGDTISGFVLFDALRAIDEDGTPITTVALGQAASMAAVLVQAGRERVVGPHARFLIHQIQLGAQGKLSDVEIQTGMAKEVNESAIAILSERSGKLTKNEIRSKIKKGDWALSAQKFIDYGFADRKGYR